MSRLSAKKALSLGASLSEISQLVCGKQFGIAQRRLAGIILAGLIFAGVSTPALSQQTWEDCNGDGTPSNNPNHILPAGSLTSPQDLRINGVACVVDGTGTIDNVTGTYVYQNVNIYNGGSLTFQDKQIDFHVHSILVEKASTLQASGTSGLTGPLTIWLWGSNDLSKSITCLSDSKNQCGVPDTVWNSNPNLINHTMGGMSCNSVADPPYVPTGECFYQYDIADTGAPTGAYFGNKVLAVSYGGTLTLTGSKGIRAGIVEDKPADSSTSWVRLHHTLNGGEPGFYVDRPVPTWGQGDHIVVTATDYLPGHTEEFVIDKITTDDYGTKINIMTSLPDPKDPAHTSIQNPHWGEGYDYSSVATAHPDAGPAPITDPNVTSVMTLPKNQIETRAIVALLSRSIRIASEGATPVLPRDPDSNHFPPDEGNFYGGHTIVRQGFKSYQVQGVEFYQLGQGGAIGRYPVHFHMARTVPQPNAATNERGTFVADSSIVDSMTRFVTVHATQGLTLARNVGYKSFGHGFYLEDATEINNRLYSNVGITVRAGLSGVPSNPRKVPGILNTIIPNTKPGDPIPDDFPMHSDVNNPTTFWITNTWNDFEYNAAVGAESCGACYWMPPSGISGPSQYETWNGYASMQRFSNLWGSTPMFKFVGNSCSTAMSSIQTVGSTNACNGLYFGDGQSTDLKLYSVPNPAPPASDLLPNVVGGQRNHTTICSNPNGDCSDITKACAADGPGLQYCLPFVIDRYTTSFNWPQTNFAAIWLRGWWFLLQNSAITDVQNGGLTLVSGGGYTRSDVAQGFWSVFKDSILVGNTQPILGSAAAIASNGFPANGAASNAGPFHPKAGGLPCPYTPTGAAFCASAANGITFQNQNFAISQRLFSIYDGPASEYNNIYSDIHVTKIGTVEDCAGGNCESTKYMGGNVQGVIQFPPTGNSKNGCYLPNAAIAWKQPNGFYYPPAFNSENLVFNNEPGHEVDIRHFVIQPQYEPSSFFKDNLTAIQNIYCSWAPNMFSGNSFTDIDRETELTDDDGSLTGLVADIPNQLPSRGSTISVNKDLFFNAPLVTDECASGQLTNPIASGPDSGATVNTSPYEHLSTAIVADCAKEIGSTCNGNWSGPAVPNAPGGGCANVNCYGVPLYRQYKASTEDSNAKFSIFMMGQGNAQRSTMTANHGNYYIDTTQSLEAQQGAGAQLYTVFQPNTSYELFLLFGTDKTQQTYQMYIGKGLTIQQAQAAIKPGRMQISSQSYPFCSGSGDDPDVCQTTCGSQCTGSWATVPDTGYDMNTGILTVEIDLTKQADMQVSSREPFCQPTTYCQWNPTENTCGCKTGTDCNDPKVCSFATKDIDCPIGGCYGFRITMPGVFGIPPLPTPPATIPFPTDKTAFAGASMETAGNCYYDPSQVPKLPTPPKKRRVFEPLSTEPINWGKF
jgi:hypothetical protein